MLSLRCPLRFTLLYLACGEEHVCSPENESSCDQTSLLQTSFQLAPSTSSHMQVSPLELQRPELKPNAGNRFQLAPSTPSHRQVSPLELQRQESSLELRAKWKPVSVPLGEQFEKTNIAETMAPIAKGGGLWSNPMGDPPSSGIIALIAMPFVFGVLFGLLVMLFLLELLINCVAHLQKQYLTGLENCSSNDSLGPDVPEVRVKAQALLTKPSSMFQDSSAPGDTFGIFMPLVKQLLDLENRENYQEASEELVRKASEACSVKLSPKGAEQACAGLQSLLKTVRRLTLQSPRGSSASSIRSDSSSSRCSRRRWQEAVKRIILQMKVAKAFKAQLFNGDQEEKWTIRTDHGPVLSDYKDVRLRRSGLQRYFASEKFLRHANVGFIFFYSQTCAIAYAAFVHYCFPYLFYWAGPLLLLSRGEAMASIVLTALMLVLMARGVLTKLRRFVQWSSVLAFLVDNPTFSHTVCGMMLVLTSGLHIFGHISGFIPSVLGLKEDWNKEIMQNPDYFKFKLWMWARTFTTKEEAFFSWPAVTGYLLVIVLVLFWLLSRERVRRWWFELFQYAHVPLICLWSIGLVAHGWQQILGFGQPLALLVVIPLLLYNMIESKIYSCQLKITGAIIKRRTLMLELDTCDSDMQYSAGMYCMLNVPDLAQHEWHPFTIACSEGQQKKFQVMISPSGDWTAALKNLLLEAQREGKAYPAIFCKGGYGCPVVGLPNHKHVILVGSGVGAAPFLSFLSNICSNADGNYADGFDNIETALFYWVTREPEDFAWMNKYADAIKDNLELKNRISIRLCLSRTLEATATADCNATEMALFWMGVHAAVATSSGENTELRSELVAPTQFGRPKWKDEFAVHVDHLLLTRSVPHGYPLQVSVFFCGGHSLVEPLEEACAAVSNDKAKLRLYVEGM